ncbi:MAG: TonB-dependent receptor [Pseudomonadota bacterium]
MKANQKLSYAILAVLSAHAGITIADEAKSTGEIADVVVTAQRRSESIQNVPIAIQALTSEMLTQLNITTFEDYAKYLPNVTASASMPGIGQIYMRGLATTEDGAQSSGATGSFPNVAVYLDEQSVQLPGRNLDIYAADLERIEVLEGPQGTLFGAGAQAGVVRYITNKPKLNKFEAIVNAGYSTTAHGDPSSNIDATINLPLIPDKFAVRAVVYNEARGGYINNLASTFTRRASDVGIVDYFGGVVPQDAPVINNNAIAGTAINPVTYKGMRLSGLFQINEDWNVLLTQSYQSMEADGVFAQMPYGSEGQKLPELSVTLFNPSWNKDKFSNTALTVNGRIGALKAVYTGGYLVRKVDQVADYTNYARGVYADYYQCVLPGSPFVYNPTTYGHDSLNPSNPGRCGSPSAVFKVIQRNVHQSHEFRLSTPDDWRVRAIGGLFWEDFKIEDQSDWHYKDASVGFSPLIPPTGATVVNPNVRDSSDAFFDDVTRGYKQKAVFASVDFDILPKELTLTLGTRWYDMDTYELGAKVGSFGCRQGGYYSNYGGEAVPNPCVNGYSAKNLDGLGLQKTYRGFKSRANLTWKITPDALVYATWSQGFRPGGFNRGSGSVGASSPLNQIWSPPASFSSDTLINKEVGWKTQWLGHRLQFNGAVYQEDWKDVQIGIFDPGVTGNLTFTTNGPDYRVKGAEMELVARVTQALTVSASGSYNKSELVKEVNFLDLTGNPIDWASLHDPRGNSLRNPFGVLGDPLAQAPKVQGSVRVRYDFSLNDYEAFWQVAGAYHGSSYSTTDRLSRDLSNQSIAYLQPSYSQFDASTGVSKDAWSAQLYCSNLTDKRSILNSNYGQWIKMDTVTRPRTIGVRFGYKF